MGSYILGYPGIWLMAAGTALVALRRRSPEMKMLHSLTMMIFFQYAGFCIPGVYDIRYFWGSHDRGMVSG